jgi:small subunit ribosomal protein S16
VAVKIRLKRTGKIRVPHYRIVVADSRTKRDGRVIEEIGKYHPKEDPSLIEVDSERAQYWLGVGAQPSEPVLALLKLTGDWQRFQGDADATSSVRLPESKREKSELFNEALKDAHNEPKTDAVTRPRKAAKKAPAAAADADAAPAATKASGAGGDAPAVAETSPAKAADDTAPGADASTPSDTADSAPAAGDTTDSAPAAGDTAEPSEA